MHDTAAPSELPIARIKLPVRVPLGLHGSWVDQAVLDRSIATLAAGSGSADA